MLGGRCAVDTNNFEKGWEYREKKQTQSVGNGWRFPVLQIQPVVGEEESPRHRQASRFRRPAFSVLPSPSLFLSIGPSFLLNSHPSHPCSGHRRDSVEKEATPGDRAAGPQRDCAERSQPPRPSFCGSLGMRGVDIVRKLPFPIAASVLCVF